MYCDTKYTQTHTTSADTIQCHNIHKLRLIISFSDFFLIYKRPITHTRCQMLISEFDITIKKTMQYLNYWFVKTTILSSFWSGPFWYWTVLEVGLFESQAPLVSFNCAEPKKAVKAVLQLLLMKLTTVSMLYTHYFGIQL